MGTFCPLGTSVDLNVWICQLTRRNHYGNYVWKLKMENYGSEKVNGKNE